MTGSIREIQPRRDGNEKIDPYMGKGDLEQGQASQEAPESSRIAPDNQFLVSFTLDDPGNPLTWSRKRKWAVTAAVSGTGFVRIMVSTVCSVNFCPE
jgi:hypothetical protein